MNPPPAPIFLLRLFGVFLCFATCMAALAAWLLAFPGTRLDRLWALNPRAHAQFASLGSLLPWAALGFLLMAIVGVYTTRLWFQRRFRGWRIATFAIAIQAMSDAVNFLRGDYFAGLLGLLIASVLLTFLLSRPVKAAFH